jgi:hypothetical protein
VLRSNATIARYKPIVLTAQGILSENDAWGEMMGFVANCAQEVMKGQ